MKNLAQKLMKFRSDMSVVVKDSNNPFFKSKYADLPSILAEIKPILTKHGLAIVHAAKFDDMNHSFVETTIIEVESGESITSSFPIFGTKPQEIGSSMTYARRYNIQALLDLSTEDDDGNLANAAPATKKFEQDDRPWFNQPEYEKLVLDLGNGEVFSKSAMKSDYKINKEMQTKLATLTVQYPTQFQA